MLTVTRVITLEIEDGSDNTLIVEASVGIEDDAVCVAAIDSITFRDASLGVDRDWDTESGIGEAIKDWLIAEVEGQLEDDAHEIASEISDAVMSQIHEAERDWQRDYEEAS